MGLVIPRLRNVNVQRLSGGATTAAAVAAEEGVLGFSSSDVSAR